MLHNGRDRLQQQRPCSSASSRPLRGCVLPLQQPPPQLRGRSASTTQAAATADAGAAGQDTQHRHAAAAAGWQVLSAAPSSRVCGGGSSSLRAPPSAHRQHQHHPSRRSSRGRLVCAAAASSSSSSSLAPAGPAALAAVDEKVWIPFKPDFYSSQPVQIQGSFNDWSQPFTLNHDPQAGKVGGVVQLDARHGVVSFKYQVGDKWFLSREDAAASDNQGCINNTTAGRQTVTFKFPGAIVPPPAAAPGYEVHVCGSFTDWQVSIPLALGPDGDYYAKVALTPGHHTFKFLLDAMAGVSVNGSSSSGDGMSPGHLPVSLVPGSSSSRGKPVERRATWVVVDWLPIESAPGGQQVNGLNVPPPPTFKVLYHTPFKEAYIHYRFKGQSTFERARMYHQPDASGLMVAQLPAPDMSCQLEFSITGTTAGSSKDGGSGSGSISSSSDEDSSDVWTAAHLGSSTVGSSSSSGNGNNNQQQQQQLQQLLQQVVRDPPGGADKLYTAVHPGVWRLKEQQLNLDAAGQLGPLMLCTDLDGTLIEDAGEDSDFVRTADASTRRCASYFGRYLAPSGGVMVFNTGRSIGMVEGLLAKKGGTMPRPQAIITAVGTKVFLWDVATERWVPDPFYAMLLNEGWDAEKVSQLATELRNRYNGQVSVVDDGTEHPHRLSLTIRSEISDKVTQRWSEGLKEAGVKHQMVASIGGEWRYVDCISAHAGKGRAMLYVASRYGILTGDVVGAGDSGNDLLMLGPVDGAYHPAIVMSNSHPEVWDWFNKISPRERTWVYTPKGERAAGLVEGMKAIVAEKLRAKSLALQQQQQQKQQQRAALPQPQGQQPQQQPGGASQPPQLGGGGSSGSSQTRSVRMLRT